MALIFSTAECGISSVMASSKKQTSSCSISSSASHIVRCLQRIDRVLDNPNSSDRDDACEDCESDLEEFADRCLNRNDARIVYDGLEEACGAMAIGMSLFSMILAVLVAVASFMN